MKEIYKDLGSHCIVTVITLPGIITPHPPLICAMNSFVPAGVVRRRAGPGVTTHPRPPGQVPECSQCLPQSVGLADKDIPRAKLSKCGPLTNRYIFVIFFFKAPIKV